MDLQWWGKIQALTFGHSLSTLLWRMKLLVFTKPNVEIWIPASSRKPLWISLRLPERHFYCLLRRGTLVELSPQLTCKLQHRKKRFGDLGYMWIMWERRTRLCVLYDFSRRDFEKASLNEQSVHFASVRPSRNRKGLQMSQGGGLWKGNFSVSTMIMAPIQPSSKISIDWRQISLSIGQEDLLF